MKNLSLLGILFLAFFGCRNDIDEMNGGSSTVEPPIIIQDYDPDSELVTGTVFGRVYDEQENPVVDALVQYDGQNYTTDEDGRFFITDETLDKQGTFLTVEADGFFKGSRRFNPQDSSVNYVYVQLLALNEIGTFEAANGAELNGDDGLGITFPPNIIQSASGALYSGQVSVAAKWLDPTADNIGEIMPGNLLGLNSQIEEVALVSYGMAAVELFGENGEKLNVAEGQTATLSFPVPQELLNTAPATIPLWSFEEEQFGIWVEEGTATLQGNRYVGEVSHFSFWNCDVPFDLVFLEGQLLTENGTPLINTQVNITPLDKIYGRSGHTDNRGYFSGKMPKGIDLTLSVGVLGQNCEFDDIKLGSFDVDENLGPLILQSQGGEFMVVGSFVNCDNNPVTNGSVNINFGNYSTIYYLTKSNTINIGVLNCDNASEVNFHVIDFDNYAQSTKLTIPVKDEIDLGELMVCDTLAEFITININDLIGSSTVELAAKFEKPETSEFLSISAFFLGDSLEIGSGFSFSLNMEIGLEGTYDSEAISIFSIETRAPAFFETSHTLSCSSSDQCPSLEVNITENGGLSGFLAGNFSGEEIFIDPTGVETSFPFSGSFRMPIEQF